MSTAEQKAEQRKLEREKRQARIRAGGSNRLAKITGTAGSKDFKPPPQTELQPQTLQRTAGPAEPADAASYADKAEDPLFQLLKQHSESSANGENSSDPFMSMLAAMQQQTPPDGSSSSPSSSQQQQQQHFAAAQYNSSRRAELDWMWDLLHLVLSVVLGLYAALGNPWRFSTVFVTMELVLIATKLTLGQHNSGISAVAMFAPFIGMLPKKRQRQVTLVGTIYNAARSAYRDAAIALFVFGCMSLGSSFNRME